MNPYSIGFIFGSIGATGFWLVIYYWMVRPEHQSRVRLGQRLFENGERTIGALIQENGRLRRAILKAEHSPLASTFSDPATPIDNRPSTGGAS